MTILKKPKPIIAFAAIDPHGHINPYWIRAHAKDVRCGEADWKKLVRAGWRVARVRVTLDTSKP